MVRTSSSRAGRRSISSAGLTVAHVSWASWNYLPRCRPIRNFSVTVDRGDGQAETIFETSASFSMPTEDVRYFDLPLLETSGLVRIRLMAEGRGAVGTWRNLEVISSRSGAERSPVTIPKPPKLVVLYVLDALRGDHVGHLGSTWGRHRASTVSLPKASPSPITSRSRRTPDRRPSPCLPVMVSSRAAGWRLRAPRPWPRSSLGPTSLRRRFRPTPTSRRAWV